MRFIIAIACIVPLFSWGQIGGEAGYQTLNLTTNPRAAALGGTAVSLADGDISQFFENPATLDSVGTKNLFFHLNPYFADVFVYTGAYSFNVANAGTFAAGLHYVNYGSFEMTDETGASLGTFQAQDYTFQVGKAHQLGPITLGANLKLTHSSIESFGSTALLMDIGGVFRPSKNWTIAMVMQNMGLVVSKYTSFENPSIPFDVKLGTSFKPQYMPLRFTLTTTNLVDRNLNEDEESSGRSNEGIDKVWKRVNLGAEVLLSNNFQLLIGYSHKRGQELRLSEVGGGAGLSYGLMLKVKRIELRFSRATYHVAGGSSFISLRTDLNDFKKDFMKDIRNDLTPKQIVEELDKYIIGQKDAKRNVAIALRNRWRRMKVKDEIQGEIVPNNILLIGSTGVGKTEIARRLAKIADAPFTKVEASKFTEVGYVGRDVESMVRDLVEQAVNMVKISKKEEVKEKAAEVVEGIILDALIPPLKGNPNTFATKIGSDDPENEVELNEQTRTRFREKIRNGELDDRKIEIDVTANPSGNVGMIGGGMDEASMINIQEMIGNMMPKKKKKRKVSIAEARKILLEEEAAKMIDMDEVKEEAINKAENTGIIFIDEMDKIAKGGDAGKGPDVSREGVQRDLLPIVEGSAVNTKYGIINTDHILFVAAGAFHFSKPSDLIPELQGRFPIRVELDNLTKEDFLRILTEPKNALTKQYEALVAAEDVNLTFQDEALGEIAEMAFQINEEVENIGARRLHTVMSKLLNEILFDIPDTIGPNAHIVIDEKLVKEKLAGLVKDKDLSRYIL